MGTEFRQHCQPLQHWYTVARAPDWGSFLAKYSGGRTQYHVSYYSTLPRLWKVLKVPKET